MGRGYPSPQLTRGSERITQALLAGPGVKPRQQTSFGHLELAKRIWCVAIWYFRHFYKIINNCPYYVSPPKRCQYACRTGQCQKWSSETEPSTEAHTLQTELVSNSTLGLKKLTPSYCTIEMLNLNISAAITKLLWKILFISEVINYWISITKYLRY